MNIEKINDFFNMRRIFVILFFIGLILLTCKLRASIPPDIAVSGIYRGHHYVYTLPPVIDKSLNPLFATVTLGWLLGIQIGIPLLIVKRFAAPFP